MPPSRHEHIESLDEIRPEPGELLMVDGDIDDPLNPNLPVDDDDSDTPSFDHFSYYSFEGSSGALRWKHEPGDFEVDLDVDGHSKDVCLLKKASNVALAGWIDGLID
jgi:hypothetical protein